MSISDPLPFPTQQVNEKRPTRQLHPQKILEIEQTIQEISAKQVDDEELFQILKSRFDAPVRAMTKELEINEKNITKLQEEVGILSQIYETNKSELNKYDTLLTKGFNLKERLRFSVQGKRKAVQLEYVPDQLKFFENFVEKVQENRARQTIAEAMKQEANQKETKDTAKQ